MYTYNYTSFHVGLYTSDNECVFIHLHEYLNLCIQTFIEVIILICVINELSKIQN